MRVKGLFPACWEGELRGRWTLGPWDLGPLALGLVMSLLLLGRADCLALVRLAAIEKTLHGPN